MRDDFWQVDDDPRPCAESFHPKVVLRSGDRVIAVPTPCKDPQCRVGDTSRSGRPGRIVQAITEWSGVYPEEAFLGSTGPEWERTRKRIQRSGTWALRFGASLITGASLGTGWDRIDDTALIVAIESGLMRTASGTIRSTAYGLPTTDPRLRHCPDCGRDTLLAVRRKRSNGPGHEWPCYWCSGLTDPVWDQLGWTTRRHAFTDVALQSGVVVEPVGPPVRRTETDQGRVVEDLSR